MDAIPLARHNDLIAFLTQIAERLDGLADAIDAALKAKSHENRSPALVEGGKGRAFYAVHPVAPTRDTHELLAADFGRASMRLIKRTSSGVVLPLVKPWRK